MDSGPHPRASYADIETLPRTSSASSCAAACIRVHPVLRTLEVFAREGTRWLLLDTHADDARVRAEPFTALEWNLDVLWLRKR